MYFSLCSATSHCVPNLYDTKNQLTSRQGLSEDASTAWLKSAFTVYFEQRICLLASNKLKRKKKKKYALSRCLVLS